LRIDFMRVGTGDLLARGMVRRSGRTLATVDVEITGGDGRIVALARGVLSVAA
jgi:acyl-coenzyme A thioesterase PaaI-like protein